MRNPIPWLAVVGTTLLTLACSDAAPRDPSAPPLAASEGRQAVPHAAPSPAAAAPVLTFDEATGQLPEGIAFDRRGTMYVSLAPIGQVLRVERDAAWSVLADFSASLAQGAPGALGLATDYRGRVYLALASLDPASHGVQVISRDGTTMHLAGTESMGLPNGLDFDRRGNLYVSDSALGTIWRIDRNGAVEAWLEHPWLEGTGAFGLGVPIGVNGVAVYQHTLYAVNSEQGLVMEIPILRDGAAGEPRLIQGDPAGSGTPPLFGLDGLEVDVHGQLYAAVNIQNRLVRIDPNSGHVIDLASTGLDFPAALAFGTSYGWQKTAFVANFAFVDVPGDPTPAGPGVVAVTVGVPGRP